MMAPAMRPRTVSRDIRNWPIALADAPSEMKTSEKPRMKASEDMITRLRTGAATTAVPVPRNSSSDSPEI
jgi:hypothetical protein